MSKWYAIELYLDPSMENQVLKSWNALTLRGLTLQLIKSGSRPHITIWSSTSQRLSSTKLETVIKNFAGEQEPLNLSLSSIGFVTGVDKDCIFFSPTPTLSLLRLQSRLCQLLRYAGFQIGDEFKVDSWMPVCAVELDLPKFGVPMAYSVVREVKLPITGSAMEIGLVEFSLVTKLGSFAIVQSDVLSFKLGQSAELPSQ